MPLHNQNSRQKPDGPLLLTARFWKRFVVVLSVALSITALILSSISSLRPENQDHLRRLIISGIIVNAISVSLSALTSLDWRKETTNDRVFADRLLRIAHVKVEENGEIVIRAKDLEGFD